MGGGSLSDRRGSNLKDKALRELRTLLVMFLYLWLLFAISDLHRTVILAENHLNYQAQGFAAINALMLAKVMLLAENLKVGRRFSNRMLILSIPYQAFALTILFIAFHVLEKGLVGHFEGKTFAQSLPDLHEHGLLVTLSDAALVFVALIPFFAFKGIADAIGEREMRAILFGGKKAESPKPQEAPTPEKDLKQRAAPRSEEAPRPDKTPRPDAARRLAPIRPAVAPASFWRTSAKVTAEILPSWRAAASPKKIQPPLSNGARGHALDARVAGR
ncbi:hypothetical protein [Methylocapsa acidiphila]|uniref:hypothetical protein n=1 Tax=Methylocapsa acidiphila TaxID=133552 RepID=UPI00040AE2FC|nr:hypothetical protein [Methylocapsa acidiphila]